MIGSSKLSVFESAFGGSTEDEEVTLATAFSARAVALGPERVHVLVDPLRH